MTDEGKIDVLNTGCGHLEFRFNNNDVYPQILGRLGNTLYSAAAALAYSRRHGLKFSMPSQTTDSFWKPTYLSHLVDPTFNPNLPNVIIQEKGYPYREIPFKGGWARTFAKGFNIRIEGYRQSEKYFADYREEVLKAFGFPWELNELWVAVHVRRGDALRYPEKHIILTKEYYEEQMEKFPGHMFRFFSDDLDWCKENFRNRSDCVFEIPKWATVSDHRQEVQDLVDGSWCEHQIGSASTFALWQAILNRNPEKRCIFPKHWIKEGWEGTTAETWKDVVPTGKNWERA